MKSTLSRLLCGLCLLLALGSVNCSTKTAVNSDPTPITSSIVDPTELDWITKYGSCCHVENPVGSGSSQKHYLQPLAALMGMNNTIKMYAPCTGKIFSNKDQLTGCSNGAIRGSDIYIKCDSNDVAVVILFHIDLLSGITTDSTITSGQHIGYASLYCAGQTQTDFDMTYFPDGESVTGDSIFLYMTPEALAPWTARGITADNVISTQTGACTEYTEPTCHTQRVVF